MNSIFVRVKLALSNIRKKKFWLHCSFVCTCMHISNFRGNLSFP